MVRPRRSQRRKLAVATWRAPVDGRIFTRLELDARPVVEHAAELTRETGERVTVSHVVGHAVGLGLVAVPAFNCRVLLGRVVPHRSVDVGFAVDVEQGDDLAPIVVRGIDRLGTVDVARIVGAGASTVRAGRHRGFSISTRWVRLLPPLAVRWAVRGFGLWGGGLGLPAFGQPGFPLGSALVSSVGSLGLDEGWMAPVPFARAALYVSVGRVRERPAVEDGRVVARPTVVLSATADHRLVDGAHAARLADWLTETLAEPAVRLPR